MLIKISFNLCVVIVIIIIIIIVVVDIVVVIKINLILCIDLSRDTIVFTRYRMTNMSGQLSQCRN